jgi:hypothetical protein
MIEQYINDKFKYMWKEPILKYYLKSLNGGTEENHEEP